MNIQDAFDPYEIAKRASAPARECNHASQELRFLKQSNGNILYKNQCLRCGQTFPNIPHDKLTDAQKQAAKATDDTIRQRFEKENEHVFNDAFTKAKAERKAVRRRKYNRYLESDEWKQKRDKVLKRANGICEGCLENPAKHVHHLHYGSIFDELLFDLVAICESCHAKIHPELDDLFESERFTRCFEGLED